MKGPRTTYYYSTVLRSSSSVVVKMRVHDQNTTVGLKVEYFDSLILLEALLVLLQDNRICGTWSKNLWHMGLEFVAHGTRICGTWDRICGTWD